MEGEEPQGRRVRGGSRCWCCYRKASRVLIKKLLFSSRPTMRDRQTKTHDDTVLGLSPETHDDTGLVLNEKPMMTETPQTRKKFFLEKKVGPRKIFFGIFFSGGFGKPVSSWVLVEFKPLRVISPILSPGPHSAPPDSLRVTPRVSWSPCSRHLSPAVTPRVVSN